MENPNKNEMIQTLFLCGIKKPLSVHRLLERAKVDLSLRTVERKIEVLNRGENLEQSQVTKTGRPPILSEEDKMEIEELLEEDPTLNSVEILSETGLDCTARTIRNYLNSQGYKWKSVKPTFHLEEKHIISRLKFAKDHLNDDWNETVFLDESTFRLCSSVSYCYQKEDHKIMS